MPLFEIVLPITSKFYWELDPFFYLFRKFWGNQIVTILSDNVLSIPKTKSAELRDVIDDGKWHGKFSANLLGYLLNCKTPNVIILMADYWITEKVNLNHINQAARYMIEHPEVIRLQISNGMGAGESEVVDKKGKIEIRDRSEFLRGSLIPGMWSRDLLIKHIRGGWDLWTFEQEMSRIINTTPEIKSYLMLPEIITYSHSTRTSSGVVNFNGFPSALREEVKGFVPSNFIIGE